MTRSEIPFFERFKSDKFFQRLRNKEYSRLDKQRHVYLDYTGGGLYPVSLLKLHKKFLLTHVYGNPHSTNPASQLSEKYITQARIKVLEFFNAKDYYCIFTPNASGALKIVGECYPFSSESHLLLTADNHNSVNGIRDYCRNKGSSFTYSQMNEDDLSINETALNQQLSAHPNSKNKLFAYPAQSNVSGTQHSLSWIRKAHTAGWDVLLDAAAYVPTSALDLSEVHPEFVSISFYKIFGYPTGIGCLLLKKNIYQKLVKPWYAGGTITISAVRHSSYFLKPDHERFEDGTINYLNIPAITSGLSFISKIGMKNINSRIHELTGLLLQNLLMLRHANGAPLIKIYGNRNNENRGGTIMLNFLNEEGKLFPFQYIEACANRVNISLRSGCFCNPGIDETNHCLSTQQLKGFFTSRKFGDYYDMIQYLGELRGAVRVSLGIPTTRADLFKFIAFAKSFLNKAIPTQTLTDLHLDKTNQKLPIYA